MFRQIESILVISILFVLDVTGVQALDLQRGDAFEEMASKTVRLHITGTPDGATGIDEYGTGFFINGGHIVTAAHVFGESDWQLYNDGRPNLPTIDIDQPNAYGVLVPILSRNSGAR